MFFAVWGSFMAFIGGHVCKKPKINSFKTTNYKVSRHLKPMANVVVPWTPKS